MELVTEFCPPNPKSAPLQFINVGGVCLAAEFLKLAELPCLEDLVFVGNPLEEKHSAEGNWIDEATKRVPKLKKLDGECPCGWTQALCLGFGVCLLRQGLIHSLGKPRTPI